MSNLHFLLSLSVSRKWVLVAKKIVKVRRSIFCYADVGCYLNIFRLVIAIHGICTFIFTNLLFCLYVFCHVEDKFLLYFLSLHEQQRPTLFAHSLNFLSLRKISSFCRLCNTAMSYWTTRRYYRPPLLQKLMLSSQRWGMTGKCIDGVVISVRLWRWILS